MWVKFLQEGGLDPCIEGIYIIGHLDIRTRVNFCVYYFEFLSIFVEFTHDTLGLLILYRAVSIRVAQFVSNYCGLNGFVDCFLITFVGSVYTTFA